MKLPSIHASMAFIITVSSLHNVSKAATARGRQLGCGTSTVLGRRRSRACFVHHLPLLGHPLHAAKSFRSEAERFQPYSFQRRRPLDLSAAPSGANHDGHRRNTSRSNSGKTANPIPTRRADDYDNTIFAPALPKESVSSKSMSSLENSRDASGESYGFFDSNYYSDESPDNSAVPKRLESPPSNQPREVSTESDDVAAFRARYQFRFNPRREMPPPLSVYDDDNDDGPSNQYNWFDEDSGQSDANETYSNGWSEEGNIVKATARILKKERLSTSIPESSVTDYKGWSEEGTIIKRTARILKLEKSSATTASPSNTAPRVVRTTARILPNTMSKSEHPYASISQTEATPKIENEENVHHGQIPHRTLTSLTFVPSFMEPEKTKAMIKDNDDSVRLSGERLTPSMPEASTGSGSTPYSTTLLYQIQHLTSQIYQLNNGAEFNIDSPKQVSRVLFGEEGFSTSKDALEALASAGNQMAACIFKYRKVVREYKRELKRMEQMERGDRKNDYYGNLARKAVASSSVQNTTDTTEVELDQTENITPPREPLLLIDASAYIFRAYHAIPPLHHSDGTPTAALHGVCRMLQNLLLNRLLRGERPRVVLVFDSKGTNFRHDIYPEYKANRGPCPEDLMPQFELVREAAEAFGVVQVEAEGYEADDVIATLTLKAVDEGVDVDILSGDKDLMQLITPPNKQPSVHMIDPMHFDRVSHDDVIKKWGVPSEKLGDILALAGDASDNIPGAPGIGPKIAASLIDEFGCLDNLIQKADTIKQRKRRESLVENAEKILLYRKIVTLDDTIPTDKMTLPPSFESVSDFRMSTFDPNKLIDFYTRLELNACKRQLQNRLRSSWIEYKAPPSPDEYEGVPF